MTCRGFGQSALPDRDAAPDLTARIAERRNFNAPLADRPQAGAGLGASSAWKRAFPSLGRRHAPFPKVCGKPPGKLVLVVFDWRMQPLGAYAVVVSRHRSGE